MDGNHSGGKKLNYLFWWLNTESNHSGGSNWINYSGGRNEITGTLNDILFFTTLQAEIRFSVSICCKCVLFFSILFNLCYITIMHHTMYLLKTFDTVKGVSGYNPYAEQSGLILSDGLYCVCRWPSTMQGHLQAQWWPQNRVHHLWINLSSHEAGRFDRTMYVNTMTADVLAPCVAKTSAAMVLTMWDKQVFVFHMEEFQLPVPSQYWKIPDDANTLCVSKKNSSRQGVKL